MDFSSAGLKEGFIKFIKVVGWVAASGAVASLVAELAKYQANQSQIYAVALVLILNALLAGVQEWLSTHKPDDVPPTP